MSLSSCTIEPARLFYPFRLPDETSSPEVSTVADRGIKLPVRWQSNQFGDDSRRRFST
jgi:hypothetical protein